MMTCTSKVSCSSQPRLVKESAQSLYSCYDKKKSALPLYKALFIMAWECSFDPRQIRIWFASSFWLAPISAQARNISPQMTSLSAAEVKRGPPASTSSLKQASLHLK